MKTRREPLRELWVIEYACGAFRTSRTRIGAEQVQHAHAEAVTC